MKLKKNIKKQSVVRRKVIQRDMELQQTRHKLKIEASLEKVRTIAMHMKKPADMLKICKAISQQLRSLGVKEVRNVQTAVIYKDKGTYLNFEFYAKHDKFLTTEVEFNNHPINKAFVKQMLSGANVFFNRNLKGKKVQEWYNFQKTTNPFADKYLAKATSLNYYWCSLGPVALGISTYVPLTTEEEELFKRFRNVFELSYQRYLDIEKAEAQAREAQIQLALERVRARTMAMQRSDELPETTHVLFEQLKVLGETAAQISIGIIKEEEGVVELSATVHGNQMLQTYRIPLDEPVVMKKVVAARGAKLRSLRIDIRGKQLKQYNDWRNSVLEKKIKFTEVQWIVNVVFFSKGFVSFSSDTGIREETFDLLQRFAAVFDQTYTRFLDLQKAEEQAREAQIELGLERVRARAMAMQKSDELSELVDTVFKELTKLDFALTWCIINIIDENSMSNTVWAANPDINKAPESYHMLFEDYPFHHAMMRGWKERRVKDVYVLEGHEKKVYDEYLFNETEFRRVPAAAQAASRAMEKYVVTFSFSNFGGLQTVGDVPLSDANLDILSRFGKVFDLTYTRFNDLLRAEAQAREAKIEAALEKVRSRSLAMHHTEEIKDVITLVRKKLKELDIAMASHTVLILTLKEGSKDFTQWIATPEDLPGDSTSRLVETPYFDHPIFLDFWKNKERGLDFFAKTYTTEEKNNFFMHLLADRSLTEGEKRWIFNSEKYSISIAIQKHSAIVVGSFSDNLLSEKENEIVKRFARVFEQAYIRFLDLQNAEAQAREAKIEAVLERVRSRTMAMQRSAELTDVAGLLFEQVSALGIKTWTAGFNVWSEDNNSYVDYITSPQGGFIEPYIVYTEKAEALTDISNARKSGVDFDVQYVEGEKIKQLYLALTKLDEKQYEIMLQDGVRFPPHQYEHFVFGSKVSLMFITYEPVPEAHDIFKRLGKVFEQTYTRFLDLQKAEALAREAKIEAALERVRSRSMGMQKSDELREVIQVVYEQFGHLNIHVEHTGFIMDYKERDGMHIWLADKHAVPFEVTIPYFDCAHWNSFNIAREKGLDFFANHLDFEEKNRFYQDLFKLIPGVPAETLEYYFSCPGLAISTVLLENVGLYIENFSGIPYTDEENATLMRFGKVFQQTYTRFLDLQTAEAQAREAEIELALERVRAKSMAMQRSEELQGVVETVFERLNQLNVELYTAIIIIFSGDSKDIIWWMANRINQAYSKILIRYANIPYLQDLFEAREKGEDMLSKCYFNEEKNKLYNYLFEHTGLRQVPAEQKKFLLGNEFAAMSVALANNIGIHITSYAKKSFSDGENEILRRFAKVFDQSYTRFLDLQKAEVQAREAEIELGLERVRARAMAMQTSEELKELIGTVFTELTRLDLVLTRCVILIYEGNNKGVRWWMANSEAPSTPMSFFVKYANMPFFDEYFKGWQSRSLKWQYVLEGENKIRTDDFLFNETDLSQLPDFVISGMRAPERVWLNASFNNFGNLTLASLAPLSGEHFDILLRFAKVFDLTYTRFNDLKQAEAQAREAQIEAVLERIRSQSLAMHHSDELKNVISIMFQKLNELKVLHGTVAIQLFDFQTKDSIFWAGNDFQSEPQKVSLPYDEKIMREDTCHRDLWKAMTKGEIIFNKVYSKEQKDKWFEYVFAKNDLSRINSDTREIILQAEIHTVCFIPEKNSALFADSWDGSVYTVEDLKVLKRAAKVFEQAYIRFLDLQKAEAQARESQIQLALERVRARTMAMHKSEELNDVAVLLFNQVSELGIKAWTTGFNVWSDDNNFYTDYITSPLGNIIKAYKIDATTFSAFSEISDAKKRGNEFWVQYLEGDRLRETYKRLSDFGDEKQYEKMLEDGAQFPSHQFDHFVFGSKVSLMFITYDPIPEAHDIFKRFGKVFEQTYTRFLDLQKSEAQAREAQIQLALERVRARTMAMHRSEEIAVIVGKIFEELKLLDVVLNRILIWIFKEQEKHVEWWSANAELETNAEFYRIPYSQQPVFLRYLEAWRKKKSLLLYTISGDAKDSWENFLFSSTELSKLPNPVKEGMRAEGTIFTTSAIGNYGLLMSGSVTPLSEENTTIIQRFGLVFEQAYMRYLDVQKAEAQAREAQIEASLEKVRGSAMAMHDSNDISSTTTVVFIELKKLGIHSLRCGIVLLSENSRTAQVYAATAFSDGELQTLRRSIEMTDHPSQVQQYESWVKQENYIAELSGEELRSYYHLPFFYSSPSYVPPEDYEQREYGYYIPFSEGLFYAWTKNKYSESEINILNRFKSIVGLTFRRYLDLQKAEAQAREAQIEAALERVRSKAMAMHKTEDFHPAVAVVFEELDKLNLGVLRCGISVLNKEKRVGDVFLTSTTEAGSAVQVTGDESFDIHPLLSGAFDAWVRQEDFAYLLEGDDLTNYYKAVKDAKFQLPESQFISPEMGFKRQFVFVPVYHAGGLFAFQETEFSDEAKKVMKRFANVFDLTYKRFVDIQKAETQAREAKIEAAMEKVRARAMAMQKAEELIEVAQLLRKEMGLLGVEELETSSIYIHHEDEGTTECWYAIQDIRGEDKQLVADHMTIRLNDTWVGREMLKFYTSDQTQTSILMQGENRKEWINDCAQHSTILQGYYGEVIPERTYHLVKFSNGYMGAASPGSISAESWDLLKRATNVFSLAYTRFSDLKLAEAQAREATIEAALERVRAKAMAMHNSDDVSSAASMVFTELRKLGINPIRCGVGLLNNESMKAPLYSATSSADGDSLSLVGWVLLEGHPVLEEIYQKWLTGEDYFPELTGDSLKSYYAQLLSGLSVPVPDFKNEQKQYGHFFSFSIGCLYAWSDVKYNDSEIKILKRFASIIDLTFRRYMDLQKSEANAREAIKQAAVDRIRADIASMRTVNDLDRITPLIWNELTILGLPFIRCGVFLMDETQRLIHTFLSTPDGKAIGAFHMPYDTPGNLQKVLSNWQQKRSYSDHWDEDEFVQFANILVRQGALATPEQYLKTLPQGGFYLHFLPFLQGMLYVGNPTALNQEQLNLVKAVAEAFSTAYARYEDFTRLEAAKQQIEKTLVDLKQTQQQLVQSEKMASLGELTAGIAHEIQNPLNFVNNFSEVSNELLDEMKQELAIGNGESAIQIVDDVKQNLEKILHHGRRADAIVKGMLQHSRTSSGQKELTDINVLADEYLRLAYHGLRAKDKTFNAKFEIDLDKSIEKINVVPQEIGRVILNLINNAFYTVSEKKRQLNGAYEPTVVISTRKLEDRIEVKVKDNGNGIPQKVMEKIFQPFFTTKPTGQGTGLGLSLSYDIITKGHGGELRVETKEGEGSAFIIQLPSN